MTPDELLFTEKDGTRSSLQDVISDGLDVDYSDRYPALLHLLREGEPAHRLYSCIMLASWGMPEGLRTLIEWARDPGSTPWAGPRRATASGFRFPGKFHPGVVRENRASLRRTPIVGRSRTRKGALAPQRK